MMELYPLIEIDTFQENLFTFLHKYIKLFKNLSFNFKNSMNQKMIFLPQVYVFLNLEMENQFKIFMKPIQLMKKNYKII